MSGGADDAIAAVKVESEPVVVAVAAAVAAAALESGVVARQLFCRR